MVPHSSRRLMKDSVAFPADKKFRVQGLAFSSFGKRSGNGLRNVWCKTSEYFNPHSASINLPLRTYLLNPLFLQVLHRIRNPILWLRVVFAANSWGSMGIDMRDKSLLWSRGSEFVFVGLGFEALVLVFTMFFWDAGLVLQSWRW